MSDVHRNPRDNPYAARRREGRGAAPTVYRWWGPALFGLATAVFAGLLFAVVANGGRPLPADGPLHRWVVRVRGAPLTGIARAATALGGSAVAAGCVFVVAVVLVVLGAVRAVTAAAVLVIVAASAFVRSLICAAVGRARPPAADWITSPGGRAFPSGHTANATLAFGLLAVVVWGAVGPGHERLRRLVAAGCVGVAGAVGCSRALLGVHWPTDVLGGWAYGTAVLALVVATGILRPSGSLDRPGAGAGATDGENAGGRDGKNDG